MEKNQLIFTGVTADSRRVQSGYAFIAIKGEASDGNDFIQEAIQRGASLIISEKKLRDIQTPQIQVQDARDALANMNALFYCFPTKEIKVIGVTGTNGKTTTTHMIEKIFKQSDKEIALVSCENLTTPSSGEINELLYAAKQKGIRWAVMEVSSHGLKQKRVEAIDFDTAIFTNISWDHLDYHENFEDYLSSKKILFQGLQDKKRAIINGDDSMALKMIEGKENIYIITYGLKSKSTITASSIDVGETLRFTYCLQRSLSSYKQNTIDVQEFPIEMKLLGYHNVYNALAAITTALIYEIPVDRIQKALKMYSPVSRRLEFVQYQEYYILDDYAHNPSSFEAVFQTLQSIDYKRVYVVVATRGNRGEKINQQNAEVIANWCALLNINGLFITDSEEFVEEKDEVKEAERRTFLNTLQEKNIPFYYNSSLKKTMKKLLEELESQDMIMILGAQGMDKGKEIFQSLIK